MPHLNKTHLAFLELCEKLRSMGATQVTQGNMSATFAPSAAPRATLPPTPSRRTKSATPESFPDLPGDGPEDRERRERYRDIAGAIQG